jgi:hypothetical protein
MIRLLQLCKRWANYHVGLLKKMLSVGATRYFLQLWFGCVANNFISSFHIDINSSKHIYMLESNVIFPHCFLIFYYSSFYRRPLPCPPAPTPMANIRMSQNCNPWHLFTASRVCYLTLDGLWNLSHVGICKLPFHPISSEWLGGHGET